MRAGPVAGGPAAAAGTPSEARGSFDNLWQKLQQQHKAEASAGAGMSGQPAQATPGTAPAPSAVLQLNSGRTDNAQH